MDVALLSISERVGPARHPDACTSPSIIRELDDAPGLGSLFGYKYNTVTCQIHSTF